MSFTSNSSEETPSPSARAVNDQMVERLLSAPPAAQQIATALDRMAVFHLVTCPREDAP